MKAENAGYQGNMQASWATTWHGRAKSRKEKEHFNQSELSMGISSGTIVWTIDEANY